MGLVSQTMSRATRRHVMIADISFGLEGRGLEGRGWFVRRPRESRAAYLDRMSRVGCCKAKVSRYSRIMIAGTDLTAPLFFEDDDGRIRVDDGFHRVSGAVLAGAVSIDAVIVPSSPYTDELSRLMFDLESFGVASYAAMAAMAAANVREAAHV